VTHDFRGTLPFAWPADACSTHVGQAQLFRVGYGLGYKRGGEVPMLPFAAAPAKCEN
jgi:hypothetical protein